MRHWIRCTCCVLILFLDFPLQLPVINTGKSKLTILLRWKQVRAKSINVGYFYVISSDTVALAFNT